MTTKAPRAIILAAATAAICNLAANHVHASDANWNNGSGDFLWNTTSLNWNGAAWNASGVDGAIFGATGAGTIDLPGPINVNSMNFTANGYSLSGAGPFTFVNGTSTQTTGVVAAQPGVTAQINVPITSAVGFQKIGAGTLVLNNSGNNFASAGVPLDGRGNLRADVLVGGSFGTINGGFLQLGSAAAMPASARVSIGNGYLDIGSNTVTVSQLNFTNQNPNTAWNTTLNANNGVIGSGTLRVTGEIGVLGVTGDNFGNTIAANMDLGGGTQIIRIGHQNSFALSKALMFTGVVSNGSLLKTWGYNSNGVPNGTDGIGLLNNNTYTGSTVLNAGQSVMTGTNATSSIKIIGMAGPAGSSVALQGANGSAQSATLLQAFEGGLLLLDNNAALGTGGFNEPNIPAAQNNDRIRDDAAVELRYGSFTYRGLAATSASETFGSLNALGGHNTVTIQPNNVGAATVTGTGNLTMASRATLQLATVTSGTGNTGNAIGGNAQLKFNGTVPTPDATGILPRVISATGGTGDFVTYNAGTGMTPLAAGSYSPTFTAGTNVTNAANVTIPSSVNINALRSTASGNTTVTIDPGQTLGITSGMIFNSGFGGLTITGGVLDFGSSPGVMLGTGATTLSGTVTGSDGLIHSRGTVTYSGDFSGLSGPVDLYSGTANLNTNTMFSPINVRGATLNINMSQTAAGLGAIHYGVPETDSNLLGQILSLSISGAGANAVINRDLIVENGSTDTAGLALRYSQLPGLSPLSNNTGSQTWSGDITLNTSLRLQGGGASATSTGATVFNGDISGPGTFFVANGRVIFSGKYSNDGGFYLGDQGFSQKTSFLGEGQGNGPLTISGGNSNTVSYVDGGLQGGTIRVWNSLGTTAPQIIPLNNSTIGNAIFLDNSFASGGGDAIVNVGTGISATWAGPISGGGGLAKSGPGTLILSNGASTHTGAVTVSAGTLEVERLVGNATVSISTGATLRINPGGAVGDPAATSVFPSLLLSIAGGASPTGRLDVSKNGVVVDYVSPSPEATIRAQLISGYAGNTWTGNGITSADAAADPSGHAVGYAEAADIGSPTTFLGQPVDGTSVLFRYTRVGDADLSGTTDMGDFARLGANFNNPGEWVTGDFNYDGLTDIADFSLLGANYNQTAAGSLPRGAAVPEPLAGGLLGVALLATRRRRTA